MSARTPHSALLLVLAVGVALLGALAPATDAAPPAKATLCGFLRPSSPRASTGT